MYYGSCYAFYILIWKKHISILLQCYTHVCSQCVKHAKENWRFFFIYIPEPYTEAFLSYLCLSTAYLLYVCSINSSTSHLSRPSTSSGHSPAPCSTDTSGDCSPSCCASLQESQTLPHCHGSQEWRGMEPSTRGNQEKQLWKHSFPLQRVCRELPRSTGAYRKRWNYVRIPSLKSNGILLIRYMDYLKGLHVVDGLSHWYIVFNNFTMSSLPQ